MSDRVTPWPMGHTRRLTTKIVRETHDVVVDSACKFTSAGSIASWFGSVPKHARLTNVDEQCNGEGNPTGRLKFIFELEIPEK